MSALGRVVIAGGSGLVGRALTERLVERGTEVVVLTRRIDDVVLPRGARAAGWGGESPEWRRELDGAFAVVNLTGENVGGGRWSEARKRLLRTSRLEPTAALVEAIRGAGRRPAVFAQSSAVGYYGDAGERELDESSAPGSGFLPELAIAWEAASSGVEALGVRRLLLRTGIVLSTAGGALPKMLPAFRAGVAGRLGSGRQWFPWIHVDDAAAAIEHLLRSPEASGPFLLTAPHPVRNVELTRVLAAALRRPALVPVPAFALRFLFGEMGSVLLEGQRAVPRRLVESGFRFRYPELDGALAALLARRR